MKITKDNVMKSFLIKTKDYSVGYMIAETAGKAKQIALTSRLVTDGYEFVDLFAYRCYLLDDRQSVFNSGIIDITEIKSDALLNRLSLKIGNEYYSDKNRENKIMKNKDLNSENFWDTDLEDIEATFLPEGKK